MDDYSNFRGLAGEVIVGFVKPGSIISALPVLLFLVIGIAASAFIIPEDLYPLNFIIVLILISFAVSRFAIPAQQGFFEEGWFSQHNSKQESLAFSIRYVVITLSWSIPCLGLLWLLSKAGTDMSSMSMNPMSIASSGLVGIIGLFLVLIAIFAPTLGFLICTASDSISEVLSPAPWRELISNHKASLVVFYAAMIGGVITFWLLYFFPLFLIIIAAFAISPGLGGALTGFVFALPLLMAPILLGRLCGAFVCGISEPSDGNEAANAPQDLGGTNSVINSNIAGHIQPSASTTSATGMKSSEQKEPGTKLVATEQEHPVQAESLQAKTAQKKTADIDKTLLLSPSKGSPYGPSHDTSLKQMLWKIDKVTAMNIDNAILLTGNRVRAKPTDPFAAAELSLLLIKQKEIQKALQSMEISIALALEDDIPKLATKLLLAAGKEKFNIKLAPAHWEQLSDIFKKVDRFQTATCCLQAAGLMTAEKIENFVTSAKIKGKGKELDWLSQVLIKKFPDSPQAEQARGRL